MKMKIRRGCFETNSSSSHSICVTKNDYLLKSEDFEDYPEKIYVHKDGEWNLAWDKEELDFERHPFKFLCTFEDKVKFAIASLCGGYIDKEKQKEQFNLIVQTVQSINPKIKSIKLPEKEETLYYDEKGKLIPDSIVHFDYENDRYYYILNGHECNVAKTDLYHQTSYYGYVDHQSSGLLEEFLKSENITLVDFLRNRKYVVIISGDEYCDWDELKYSGLINIANIEKEFGI